MPTARSAFLRPRLRRGYHLFEAAGDGWLLLEPDGTFVRLHLPPEQVAALAALLRGDEPAADPAEALPGLLALFAERGLLEDETAEAVFLATRRVVLLGEGPIATALAALLREAGFADPLSSFALGDEGAIPAGTELVICCAGWLPDRAFSRVDDFCQRAGIARHFCHAEGDRFYLGPFCLPGDDQTAPYADVRARRLAAEVFPDGLEACWRYLESGQTPAVPWPDAGCVAMIAGALAADILAWAAGRQPPSRGDQLAFCPATLAWHRHPVLPVPRGLLTEAPA